MAALPHPPSDPAREPALEPPVPGSARWWQARLRGDHQRNRRRRVNGITDERIAAATVAVIEAEGLDAVTMRRIATEIGTGAASLYRHFASREELLVVVTDELLGQITFTADPDRDWRERADQFAHAFRAALLARPALVELLASAQLLGPSSLRARELVLGDLLAHGFPPALAARAYLTVTHYVMGSVLFDDRSTKREAADRAELEELFRGLDADAYPTVRGLAGELAGMHPDDEFDFGLTALLDGIAAQLAASTP